MTPFEYLQAVRLHQDDPVQLKKAFEQAKNFTFFNQSMSDGELVYSPHDGEIKKMRFHKNGILELKIHTLVYSSVSAMELPYYQLFDFLIKVEAIPEGMGFKSGSTILDLKFTENEFAIHYLDKNDSSKESIERISCSSIDVSKSGVIKFTPKKYKRKI